MACDCRCYGAPAAQRLCVSHPCPLSGRDLGATERLWAVARAAREYRRAHLAVEQGVAGFDLQRELVERLEVAAQALDEALEALFSALPSDVVIEEDDGYPD